MYISSELTPTCVKKAEDLGAYLQLPYLKLKEEIPANTYFLYVTEERLELRTSENEKTKIFADFLAGPLGYRLIHGGGHKQLIAKAVGLKKSSQSLKILDLTAGLGKDGFVLASLGCRVTLVERSKILSALLLDGLTRAEKDPKLSKIVQESICVVVGEACDVLRELRETEMPDVIYLDPMFPARTKKALTKIEMRVIHDIVGKDEDASEVLKLALKTGVKRVVVKRPKYATTLSFLKPNFVVEGSRNRYDVYFSLEPK